VIAGMIPDLSRIGPPLSSTNAGSPYNMAANLLGLNGEQRDDLFLDNLDHEQLIHDARQQTCDHAKRVVKHINRFQKEHGEQLKRTALSL
jgi:hypothetical protein